MSRLTWITEKELEREINDKEDKISLETQHEQFQQWCENENCYWPGLSCSKAD